MSGILDSKTRVLDTIITLEGRKQLSNGGINIKYVTFTDAVTFYSLDETEGSEDPTKRIYLESCHLPQDQITFKSVSSGKLDSFTSENEFNIKNGQLFIGKDVVEGNSLKDISDEILQSSIDNYQKLYSIATKDMFFEDDGFAIGNKNVEFVITDEKPLHSNSVKLENVNNLVDIYGDPRFANLINFRYLPPVNKIIDETVDKSDINNDVMKHNMLGNYPRMNDNSTHGLTSTDIVTQHNDYAKNGYVKNITFDPTSRSNNLFMQAFEISNNDMSKLDIIDFNALSESKLSNSKSQIFFIGKLVEKPITGTFVFIHLFTMIFG